MALATFTSVWILGKLVEFGTIQYHQFVQGTEKFSTPPHTSKHSIFYSNDYSDKTISQEESKETLFFKVEILKTHLSHQTALAMLFLAKIFISYKHTFLEKKSNFSYLWG